MKKFIILTLVGLMTFTGFSFADDTVEKTRVERPTQSQEERMATYRDKMTQIVETYSPELLDDFSLLWDQHDAIHLNLTALKDVHLASKQAERDEFKTEMKVLIQNKEVTREEVKLNFEEMKSNSLANREEIKGELESLKASYGISKDNFKALNDALKSMIAAEDSPAVQNQLNTILMYVENHLAFDLAKYDFLLNQE